MKCLIDECLTVELITTANEYGYHAEHVVRIGRAGWGDWNIARYAVDGEFALVTNNAEDFRQFYGAEALHPGLVILVPNVARPRQVVLFREVLRYLGEHGEPVNLAIEAEFDGGDVVLALHEFPPLG